MIGCGVSEQGVGEELLALKDGAKGMKTRVVIVLCMTAVLVGGCNGKPRTIVCLGDSLTVCGGEGGRYSDWLSKFLPEHTFVNKGVSGDTLAGGRARFQADVLDLQPDVVIIELGANDFWQEKRTIEGLRADLADMVKRAKAEGIEVVIISCFGGRDYQKEEEVEFGRSRYEFAEAIGQMEYEISQMYDCRYVPDMQADIKPNWTMPYWDDKLHPSDLGNELVAKRILPELKKALRRVHEKPQ